MRVSTVFAFVLGAAGGVAASYQYFKKKYEEITEAEIESMKEYYTGKSTKTDISDKVESSKEEKTPVETRPKTVKDYASELQKQGYTKYNDKFEENKEEIVDDRKPYIISPSEFGENDYTEVCWNFYDGDQIVADENHEMVEDVEGTIGFDSLNHFGDYEDDCVHVRNDKLRMDFEVIRVEERYIDYALRHPHKVGV